MKFLLIQLSDIHFTETDNSILEKEEQLFVTVRNSALEYEEIFLLVTGDSSFSGNATEYGIASKFLNDLKSKLEKYSSKKVNCIVIPGNHDCDFSLDTKARQNQINIIQKLGDLALDESVINQCVEIQKEYFDYRDKIQAGLKPVFQNKLISTYQYELKGKKISFYSYNTAYMSEIKEQPSKLFYSIAQLPEQIFNHNADLFISLFHHPFHWLNPVNGREFATHIHNTSDFYLTGHEHIFSKAKIDDLDENTVYHIEGSVLQDSGNKFESEFNLIGFDLETEFFKVERYFWNKDKYQLSLDKEDWKNYKRGKLKLKTKYNISIEFMKVLEDIGGRFHHPNKLDIKLDDLYIFPTLRYFNANENSEDNISFILENAESVIKNLKSESKVLLFGGENIGKTSLLRTAFKILYQRGFVPVYVDGKNIKNSGIDEFKKLVEKSFAQQYDLDSLEDFKQEDISNIFILIDDVDKNPLKNQKSKGRFIKGINQYYKNILLVGNELIAIEEIVADEEAKADLFSSFHQYEILEFNHSMRAKLIQRWYSLGREEFISDEEIYKKCDNAFQSISIAMGNKIVPNYPIFLLILLQTIETSNPHDLKISSYGNYYQLLILKSLTDNIHDQADLNTYQGYCGALAHFFFEKKTTIISRNEYLDFHKDISQFNRFDLPASMTADKALETLCKVGVLDNFGDTIDFKYQYTYYYFEAQYLARHLAKNEIKDIVSKLCQRLYRTEFANILMFLIHFSNDDFIIQELIKNAKGIFKELNPCKLENDIEHLHKLVTELPRLYLQSKSVEEIRDSENQNRDALEVSKSLEPDEANKPWDLNEDISAIDVVSKLNLSFKLTEILGQVLKNNPSGEMSGPLKHEMLVETYLMGLRTLNVFFSGLNENTDFVLNQLTELLSKLKNVDKDKIEKIARHLLFSICTQISFIFVKKVSDSVGTNKLMDKYPRVQEELNFSSVKLINFLIKLDHSAGFPDRDLQTIKDSIEKHPMSYFLLRRMVLNHLHRNPVDYKDKQRICTFLGIPMESQLKLEAERKKQTGK
jgi:Calcineurin-like phosphoesterase